MNVREPPALVASGLFLVLAATLTLVALLRDATALLALALLNAAAGAYFLRRAFTGPPRATTAPAPPEAAPRRRP